MSDAGDEVTVSARNEDLPKVAKWLQVQNVQKLQGKVILTKLSPNRYRYDAALECELTQTSVVSLEPVTTTIRETFTRELYVLPRSRRSLPNEPEPTVADGEDDVPEELDNPHYDLAQPLLEELSLALDPYPRAPGEDFACPAGTGAAVESPFAVLKTLKKSS